jgi:nitrile hydratase accessory protein
MRVDEAAPGAGDGDEPRFREPWEAQAFALVLALHEAGLFPWSEWTAALAREIHAPESGPVEGGGADYRQWLAALESLLVKKGVVRREALAARAAAWERAARATPHGAPIVLANDPWASTEASGVGAHRD